MGIMWADPAVQAAAIESIGGIAAAAIAAIAATVVGKKFMDQRYLRSRLLLAQKDVEFLLAVEEAHCSHHAETVGSSLKRKMRESVRERGLAWSGKFTPGRSRERSNKLLVETE